MRTSLAAATLCAGLALATGCQTTGARLTTIESDPPDALVKVDGFGECETPCTIEHDAVRRITIAKAGYKKQEFEIAPGAGLVRVTLELVAPAGDVEASALPDL